MKKNMFFLFSIGLLFFNSVRAEPRKFSKEFNACISKSTNINSQSFCIEAEIKKQTSRLNKSYNELKKIMPPDDQKYLDKVQREWISWKDDNYNFLSEHVSGEFVTTRSTSLNFLLNSTYDRADELEMIIDEMGN